MPTHRCSRCGIDWPHTADYIRCPRCEESTSYFYNKTSITETEARYAKFDAYVAKETDQQAAERRARWEEQKQRELDELERLYDQTPPEEATHGAIDGT